jgi:hypothetical protein
LQILPTLPELAIVLELLESTPPAVGGAPEHLNPVTMSSFLTFGNPVLFFRAVASVTAVE